MDLDLHMTKDGHLVVIHDATVNRTTNGKGRVDSYLFADLQKLDAGYTFKDLNNQFSYRGRNTERIVISILRSKMIMPSKIFHRLNENYAVERA